MRSDLRATIRQIPKPKLGSMGARKANADAMLWWDSFDEGAQFHEPTTFGTPDGGESTATDLQSQTEGTESGSDSSSNISLEEIGVWTSAAFRWAPWNPNVRLPGILRVP